MHTFGDGRNIKWETVVKGQVLRDFREVCEKYSDDAESLWHLWQLDTGGKT